MGPRIYPSYQDTNTTAKGSIIIDYQDIIPDNFGDYIQVTVNNEIRFLEYQHNNGLYATNVNIGDVVTISTVTPSIYYKFISVTRRDYTTDDNENDEGIVDIPIGITNDNTTTVSFTFTATTQNDSYNFEYRVVGTIGTSPDEATCGVIGFAADFDGNYSIGFTTENAYALFYSYYRRETDYPYDMAPVYYNISPYIQFKDATFNYTANIINYVVNGQAPKYLISPYVFLNSADTTFSASTITFDPIHFWSEMDCSYDGKYQVVGQLNGPMFVSSNSGQTYTSISGSTKAWKKVRVPNENGYPFYAITESDRDYIYQFNSISGFTTMSANARPPSGCTIYDFTVSRDNKYVVATYVFNDGTPTNNILVSSNSGSTFTTINTGFSLKNPKLAMSSTGKYVYIVETYVGYIRLIKSTDYGVTWTQKSTPYIAGYATSINCSGTGRFLYLGTYFANTSTGYNIFSDDYAISWKPSFAIGVGNVVKPNKN